MGFPIASWTATIRQTLGGIALATGLFFAPAPPQGVATLLVYDFDLGPVPASNVDQVKSLGFGGLVTRLSVASDVPKLVSYANYASSVSNFRMLAYVNYDFNNPDSPTVWRDALPTLARLDAPLWVIVKNMPTMAEVDNLLLLMAQTSEQHGVPFVIYPHWDTNIEDADEADLRIAQVGHANMFNSLHTCHEIRAGNQYAMGSVVANHISKTRLVTIAGAESNAYAGPPPALWDDAIMPLDQGEYDLLPFLRDLDNANFSGSVVLHTWGLGSQAGHLDRSIDEYSKYLSGL